MNLKSKSFQQATVTAAATAGRILLPASKEDGNPRVSGECTGTPIISREHNLPGRVLAL